MAKNIKAINCPNCGSVLKSEIRPEAYVCKSCGTEYFLDNDDVNINHNYGESGLSKKVIKIIGIALGSFILILIVASLLPSSPKPPQQYNAPQAKPVVEEKESYSVSRNTVLPFLQESTKKPIVFILETRRYSSANFSEKDGSYLTFHDPITKKLLSEERLETAGSSSRNWSFATFSDGNIYIILNESTLYKINKELLKIEEIGEEFFKTHNQLQIGIASLKFDPRRNGDLLLVHTNDDKELFYYPLIQKLYTKKEFSKAYHGFNTLLPDAKVKTYFQFTEKSSEYPEEKLQLIKVVYKDNGYGPKELPVWIKWGKDYGRAGVFTGNEPHTKNLLNKYQMNWHRVLSLKDVTPERLYFYPNVKLDDEKHLVIQFKADISEKSDFILQELNRQSGEIIWTSTLPSNTTVAEMLTFSDGFIAVSRDENIMIFNSEGIITDTFNSK